MKYFVRMLNKQLGAIGVNTLAVVNFSEILIFLITKNGSL